MAAPQGGFPPQEGYGQPTYGSPEPTQSPVQGQGAPAPAAAGKKKRAYAGEAFDFGSGANAALGGQPTAGGAYGPYPQQPQVAGYQQPVYGADPSQMQPVAPSYGAPVAADVTQMTQQFGGMGMSEPHHMPPPQPVAQAPMRPQVQLNQLYPTDLRSQPFNVAELDYPPPPIILPPGVCIRCHVAHVVDMLTIDRPVFTHRPRPIALRNICGLRSTLSPQLTPF
jgi:protein transport protein SEC24